MTDLFDRLDADMAEHLGTVRAPRMDFDDPPDDTPPPAPRPGRAFADFRWDPERRCAVPDPTGVVVHAEDFVA